MAESDPQEAAECLARGRRLHREGLFDEARLELEKACRLGDRHAAAHVALGRLLIDCHDYGPACSALLHAAELAPGDSVVLDTLGEALYLAGDFARAADVFTEAAALGGGGAVRSAVNAAVCLARSGEHMAAVERLSELAKTHPLNADVLLPLAQLRAQPPLSDTDGARAILEGILAQTRDHLQARSELGMLLARAKRFRPELRAEAVEHLEAALASPAFLEQVPDAYLVHYALGSCYDDEDTDRERAASEYAACLRLRPDFAPALSNLGIISEAQGSEVEALRLFCEAIRANPGCVPALRNLARLCLIGDEDQARAALGECLRLDPELAGVALCLVRSAADEARAESSAAICEAVHRTKNRAGVLAGRAASLWRTARDEETRAVAEEIAELGEGVFEDLRAILGLVRASPENAEVVCANELVSSAAAMLRASAPTGISVDAEGSGGRLPVLADRERIRDVIMHLGQNALAAMPHSGRLRLSARACSGRDGWVAIEVADTGEGIPADRIRDVLRPGVSLRPGGSGLGLWIADNIVRAHGGRLVLESAEGCGTRATIELPPPHSDTPMARRPRIFRPLLEREVGPFPAEMSDTSQSSPRLTGGAVHGA